MKQFNKLAPLALALGFAAGAAQAVTINNGLVAGSNTLEDASRETYVDVNNDGRFNAGDVIFGYIQIANLSPAGLVANNQIYGIFSQQIAASSSGRNVVFEATTAAGLTLKDLTGGNANVGANALAAFYDRSTPYTNLITTSAPGAPSSMQDYLNYIYNNGTLRVVAGFGDADDFLVSEINSTFSGSMSVGSSNAPIINLSSGIRVAANDGAFSVLYNNTDWVFNEQALTPTIDGQILVSGGSTTGSGNSTPLPQTWLDAGAGNRQCTSSAGVDTNCGFTDKNDFVVDVAKRVPEPGSLSLFSAALLGLAGFARRRKS